MTHEHLDKAPGFIIVGAYPQQPLKSKGILIYHLYNPETKDGGLYFKRGDNRRSITWEPHQAETKGVAMDVSTFVHTYYEEEWTP